MELPQKQKDKYDSILEVLKEDFKYTDVKYNQSNNNNHQIFYNNGTKLFSAFYSPGSKYKDKEGNEIIKDLEELIIELKDSTEIKLPEPTMERIKPVLKCIIDLVSN